MTRTVLLLLLFPVGIAFSQWDDQSTPTSSTNWCIRAVNDTVVWAGAISGVVLRTTDGGTTWIERTEPEMNFRTYAIDAIDENICWITGTDEFTRAHMKIYKTINGGTSWSLQYDQPSQGIGIRFFDADNGVAYGDPTGNWIILTTTDGGDNWNQVPETNFPAAEKVSMSTVETGVPDMESNGDHVWFVSYNGSDPVGNPNYVYHSTDRGYHWTKHPVDLSGGTSSGANVAFKNASDGVIAGDDGTRGYTSDSGVTWSMIDQASDYFYSVVHVPNTDAFIAVGDGKVVHITYDIGRTWTRYSPGSSSAYFLGADATETNAWACGGGGLVSVWNNSMPLPVEVIDFTASPTSSGTVLRWSTATETNNHGFDVERMTAQGWYKIGFVKGSGNCTSPKSYCYMDARLNDVVGQASVSGTVAYRLKQIDNDGKFVYSAVVEATGTTGPSSFTLKQNYPNPFNPSTIINFHIPENGHVAMKVFDLLGKEVATLIDEIKEAGSHSVLFDASLLSGGIYFYTLRSGNYSATKKLTLLK
jgi:photosystem II stability/assembly factor-like uncharacterized protein